MLKGEKSRSDLNKRLETLMSEILKPRERQNVYRQLFTQYNISTSIADDMMTSKRDINEFTNFEVFAMLSVLDKDSLKKYFTEEEINGYSNTKMEDNKISLPYEFKDIVQVTDDQWIGKTDVQTLMKLRDSQMINYKENAQRVFKTVKSGGIEIKRIYINNKSVEEIREAMEKGRYIPDDITLNMPFGESDFKYENGVLRVNSLPNGKFDILDGYHRFLGISKIYNLNPDFNYPMEIRIVNYPIELAQQFIFQKDQKTQMRKIDSVSFDQYSISNRVVQGLNQNPRSYLQGSIGRTTEPVNFQSLSQVVARFFVPKKQEIKNENLTVITIQKELMEKFNNLVEQRPEMLSERLDDKTLIIIGYVFASDIGAEKYEAAIDYLTKHTEGKDADFKIYEKVRRKAVTILDKEMDEFRKVV